MKPIEFPEQNIVYGEDQEEYMNLPAHISKDVLGSVISCWELDEKELEEVNKTGRIWLNMLTFNSPFQPVSLQAEDPFNTKKNKETNE